MSGIEFGDILAAAPHKDGSPVNLGEIITAPIETTGYVEFDGPEHILSIGPTRTGKGRKLLAPALIAAPQEQSIVVIDPKGELAKWTAAHRQSIGSNVVAVDPFGVLASIPGLEVPSLGYNPMRWLDPESDDFVDDCKAIAEAICPIESQSEPIWDISAQDLIAGLIMYHRLVTPDAGLAAVRAHFGRTPAQWRNLILGGTAKNAEGADVPTYRTTEGLPCIMAAAFEHKMPALRTKIGNLAAISDTDRTSLSIIMTAKSKTEFLDSVPIARDLGKPGVDFHELKQEGVTVYIVLPPQRLVTHPKWLRMVISGAINAMRVTKAFPEDRPEVLVILDEFAQLGRMEAVETGVALNAGYGIKFWIIIQDISQLKRTYGDAFETFTSAGALTSFAPRDPATSEYLAKLSGEMGVAVTSTSKSRDWNVQDSTSTNTQRREVLMPHQVRQMRAGMMFVRVPSRERGEQLFITQTQDFHSRPDIPEAVRKLGFDPRYAARNKATT